MFEPIVHFVNTLLAALFGWIAWVIESLGYVGIALLMAIESANIPLPSEAILTQAGYMVQQGKLNFHLASLAGAVGCVMGSIPSYWLGVWGGRAFLEKYGKWLLLTTHDLEAAQGWSDRYGDWTYFVCRMLPIVRTFISLPAGILGAKFWLFVVSTFVGSLAWSYFLVFIGVKFGDHQEEFKHLWHQFDAAIAVILLVLGLWYVWKHVKHFLPEKKAS